MALDPPLLMFLRGPRASRPAQAARGDRERHHEGWRHLKPGTWSKLLSPHLLPEHDHLPRSGQRGVVQGWNRVSTPIYPRWQPAARASGHQLLRNKLAQPSQGPRALQRSWRPQPWLQVAQPGVETQGKKKTHLSPGLPPFSHLLKL